MTIFEALFLGVLQGITEFLPISSSGHLVLAEWILNIHFAPEVMNAFDVTLHAGTLLALLIYFRKTWKSVLNGAFSYLQRNPNQKDKKFFNMLVLATIPAIIVGLLFKDILDTYFRNPVIVIAFMGIIGVVFLFAEKFPKIKKDEKPSFMQGILIGCAQAIALIPGVSRSGITISAGMFLGVTRHKAAEFSFILGTPALVAATTYITIKTLVGSMPELPLFPMGIGFISSFLVSILCVHYLLQFLKKHSLRVFSYYLIPIAIIGEILLFVFK